VFVGIMADSLKVHIILTLGYGCGLRAGESVHLIFATAHGTLCPLSPTAPVRQAAEQEILTRFCHAQSDAVRKSASALHAMGIAT